MELTSEWEALAPAEATAAGAPAVRGLVLIGCLRGRLSRAARVRTAGPHTLLSRITVGSAAASTISTTSCTQRVQAPL
jgi:hypothetical protein